MILRNSLILLAIATRLAGQDVSSGSHTHPAPAKIKKPRIEDTVRANIYADNWFVLYINGRLATADPIPFIPHNVVSVDLLPEYPMTIAVMARDNAHPDTGMEYNNSKIGDGGFILKFADGTVTNSSWKAKDFFHGPADGKTTNPKVRSEAIPDDWFAIDFDDSQWPSAKEYTQQEIAPKKPYFEHDFKGAKWIWSASLKLDNTVIFRTRIDAPPNGKPASSDWPRGHIIPSASDAPSTNDASISKTPTGPPPTKSGTPAKVTEESYQERVQGGGGQKLRTEEDRPRRGGSTRAETDRPQPAAGPRQTGRPNLIFILVDDMGWNDVGFAGNKIIQTPHADRLAREGVTFTQAYSSAPNCAPTRASLMSGQYPPRHGIYTVVDARHAPGSPHHKMLAASSKAELATESVTIAEQLKSSGYATAMFGMWNLGRGSNNPVSPEGQGFERFERPRSLGFEKDRYFSDNGRYLTDAFTDEAIAFIEQKKDSPFFVYLAYHAVHSPFEPKPELLAKYKKLKAPDPEYAATVEAVDQNLGRLSAALERLKLDDKTIIVFTSDNGGNRRATGTLRSGKGSLYEGGIRVPAAVGGPGIAKGIRCDAPILSMDFYPTLLDLADIKPQPEHKLDGVSFASTLHGGAAPERDAVFWHFPSYIGGGGPSSAVRMGDYKLVQLFEDKTIELYNLTKDPGESTNLAEREPEKAQQLLTTLQTWQEKTSAPLVTEPNPAYDPSAVRKKGRNQRGKGKQ